MLVELSLKKCSIQDQMDKLFKLSTIDPNCMQRTRISVKASQADYKAQMYFT